jgi:imidazolonepropionase-like amidohydrolase
VRTASAWLLPGIASFSTAGPCTELTDSASYLSVRAPLVALQHVEVIDGTGDAARTDQTVIIANGKVAAVGSASGTAIPGGAMVRDCTGYAVLPGLVGMHDHLFYTASRDTQRNSPGGIEPGFVVNEIPYSAPRLYLAAGVTTLRTAGSIEPYTDLKVRSRIEAGALPGPHLDLTAPYLEGRGTFFAQMHELGGPGEAAEFVDYWAGTGMSSFKAYMNITRAELAAAVAAVHRHGLRITAHLCSVSWPEAIAAGLDDFEHGPVYTDSEFVAGREPDHCPERAALEASWRDRKVTDPEITRLIRALVDHHVAVTSTLPVFELTVPGRPPAQRRALDAMSGAARDSYLTYRALLDPADPTPAKLFRIEMELLVEAGFTPVQAIAIGTRNGARFLGRERDIGTVEPGKRADIVLVHGDPAARIQDLENVEVVFKDGLGYDPHRLLDSVRGQVGVR